MNTYKTGKAELGRSMVEMLGVLAIIGILTVGALVGYRQAMDKLHTNEVINEANERAYTIATKLSMGIPINLSEFAGRSAVSGGNFGDDIQNWGGEFGIPVRDVPEAVCKKLIQTIGNTTALRAVTTMDNEKVTLTVDNCGKSNNLYLIYNKDMSSMQVAESSRGSNASGNNVNGNSGGGVESEDSYSDCLKTGVCKRDSDGKMWCTNGAKNPPFCSTDCMGKCQSETYECIDQGGMGVSCLCLNGRTWPNCVTGEPVDKDLYECDEWRNCWCTGAYAGDYPNCITERPTCLDAGTCKCSDGYCKCTGAYEGHYPNCITEKPACLDAGTCSCSDGYCRCTGRYGGIYPDCIPERPTCLDDGSCVCNGEGVRCMCIYGGIFPNCRTEKPACLDAGTCICSDASALSLGMYSGCQCKYGGAYPDGCLAAPACVGAGTCGCSALSCYCHHGGIYPDCE